MEKQVSPEEIAFAEEVMKLVDEEEIARTLVNLATTMGNDELEESAREKLQRASSAQLDALEPAPAVPAAAPQDSATAATPAEQLTPASNGQPG